MTARNQEIEKKPPEEGFQFPFGDRTRPLFRVNMHNRRLSQFFINLTHRSIKK